MFGNLFDLRDDLKTENKSAPDPFGRLGEDDEPDTEIAEIKNPTALKAPVGDTGQNSRCDVAKTEQLLGQAGTLDLKKTDGPTGYWGTRTSHATKAFQKQNGLKVDGQINPGGETIRALGKLAGQAVKSVTQPKTKGSRHPRAGEKPNTELKNRHPREGGDLFNEGAEKESRLRGNDNGDGVLKLTEDAFSENQRAARYLASRDGIGEFSKFVADGIETDGDKAIAETVDLYRQTAEMNQTQADALIKKVMPSLSTEHATRLKSAIKSAEQESNETISIGVWPDGEGPSTKPETGGFPSGERSEDSATDDETPNDDNLEFSRDWRDEALQHLIEDGLDADAAKQFLDRLPNYSLNSEINNWMFDLLEWISSGTNPPSDAGNVIRGETGGRG